MAQTKREVTKTQNKTQKIRSLLSKGKSVNEIVKLTKASPSMVYSIRSKVEKEHRAVRAIRLQSSPPVVVSAPSLLTRIINRIAFWR
jgi:DNA invertase Pin-like site-specific DNA recombinase